MTPKPQAKSRMTSSHPRQPITVKEYDTRDRIGLIASASVCGS